MRDNFSTSTIDTLAKRAGQCCSNPKCKIPTSGPHSDPNKSINIGVAAHISAAAPGGKRYNPHLTAEQRSSILNGIWLCEKCAKLIDTDAVRFPEELLHDWKRNHENFIFSKIAGFESIDNLLKTLIESDLVFAPTGNNKSALALFTLKNNSISKVKISKITIRVIEFFGKIPWGAFVHSTIETIDMSTFINYGMIKHINISRVLEPNEEDKFSIAFTAPKLNGIGCCWKLNLYVQTNFGVIEFSNKEFSLPFDIDNNHKSLIDESKAQFREVCINNLKFFKQLSFFQKIYHKIVNYYYIPRHILLSNLFRFKGFKLHIKGYLYYSGPNNFLKDI